MTKNKILIITALVAVAGFAAASMFLRPKVEAPPITRIAEERLVKAHNPIFGNPNAKVTVVEFLDPECESCAAFYPTIKGLINDYKDQVRLVVRYMFYHGNSKLAARATEAAGKQGKYWEMQGQLFHRTDWTHQNSPQTEKFTEVAKNLGLDLVQFKKDLEDESILPLLEADEAEAKALGVTGTPTIYVNGRKLEQLSYMALKALIDEELQRP